MGQRRRRWANNNSTLVCLIDQLVVFSIQYEVQKQFRDIQITLCNYLNKIDDNFIRKTILEPGLES